MDEIRESINRYIEDKDYEKALSLLNNASVTDDGVSALLETCKKGFTEDCAAQIAHFVQTKDKKGAEEVIEKYISLIGKDDNVTQWRTLTSSIQSITQVQTTSSGETKTFSAKEEKRIQIKIIIGALIVVSFLIITAYIQQCEAERKHQEDVAAAERAYNDPVAVAKRAEEARQDAIRDSIAAIKKARKDSIAAIEKARKAVEKARKDSIAAIEKARKEAAERAEHIAFAKKYSNLGLMIRDVQMLRGKDKDGDNTKGIKYEIFNPTQKTIKYVIAYVEGINGVGDVTTYKKACRGIGPIDPYQGGGWEFEDVLYDKNDIIVDLRVSFTVIYKNGTSKTVKLKNALYTEWFDANWFVLK